MHSRNGGSPYGHDRAHGLREQDIVCIEIQDDVPARVTKSGIHGGPFAAVLLQMDPTSIAVIREDLARIVRRTVIDDDYLDFGVGLRKRAVERIAQKAAVIEVPNDDADEGQSDSPG
jgi:hypothetical protein